MGRWKWEHKGPVGMRAIRDRMPKRRVVFHAQAAFEPGGGRLTTAVREQWSVPAWEFGSDLYSDRPAAWCTTRRPGPEQHVEAQVRGTDPEAVAQAFTEACAQAVDRAKNPAKFSDTDGW